MKKPILLMKEDLIVPIDQALNRLEKIRQRKSTNDDSIILEGLFVLAVSSFENSISDTLKIIFNQIPEKLSLKSEQVSKEDILNGNFLDRIIERKIMEKTYKNLKELLSFFMESTEIVISDFFNSDDYKYLCEIKATRNLLIHNNLRINSFYEDTAGEKIRKQDYLKIDQDYLFMSIMTLKSILTEFRAKLNTKYQNFTRIKAIKSLFNFTFDTPIMKFENEWDTDIEQDKIIRYREETSNRESLSSSEKMFFDIWLAHVRGMDRINLDISFYSLDNRNSEKLGYLAKEINLLLSPIKII